MPGPEANEETMNELFWQLLPWCIATELLAGVFASGIIWPWAWDKLSEAEATLVIACSVPLTIVPPLFFFSLLLGDTPTTVQEMGWWWMIAFLPAFLSGTITHVVRSGMIRRNEEIAEDLDA